MRTFVRLFAAVILVISAGCSDTPSPTNSGTYSPRYWPDDPDAQWRATYIRGMFHFEGNVTLSFDSTGNRIFGRSGCNEYYAQLLHPTPGVTTIGRFMGTLMGCGGFEDTEDSFIEAIYKMHYLILSPNRLLIQDAARQNLVIFRPASEWPGHR